MSKNLNNFWDDCIEEKNYELNLMINSKNRISSNSNRTKQSTSRTNNSELMSSPKKNISYNLKKKSNFQNENPVNQKRLNNRTKEFLQKWSPFKGIKTIKKLNNNRNNIIKYTFGRNKSKSNLNNKSRTNNIIPSEELRLRKNLSECTFHPKIISNVKNRNLKEKLFNYSKFSMYERGQIFEMKKKEDGQRMYLELFKKKKKYPYKPEIHKCPSFKNVLFNDSNYDSLNYFYSRMNSARENKIKKSRKIPFNIIDYDEINRNNSAYFNRSVCNKKSNFGEISFIMPKKNNKYIIRNNSGTLLTTKILNDKETEICKQNLHKALMNLELNKKWNC